MNVTVDYTDAGVTLKNTGGDAVTVPLGGGNAFQFPNGATVVPPSGKYWHIDMNTAQGGVGLGGDHGPVEMPGGSSVDFYLDTV